MIEAIVEARNVVRQLAHNRSVRAYPLQKRAKPITAGASC